MSEVVQFTGNTILPEDPAVILEKAKAWDCEMVLVTGWAKDGQLIWGGSHCEAAEILMLLEITKRALLADVEARTQ